ncbi:hypothetical protein [Desnuesiella massiliensis]
MLKDSEKETSNVMPMESGSEVELVYKASDKLKEKGLKMLLIK